MSSASNPASAPTLRLIVTHPGGAHKDDLLACAILLATHPVQIERRDATEADLDDPTVAVVDQGDRLEVAKRNFDHHQFPRDAEPRCALSLVLDALDLYADAKQFCGWLTPAEWFDCRGAKGTAEWLGVDRDIIDKLVSPIDITLLRRFANVSRLEPGEPLWEVLRWIGEDLLTFLRTQRQQIEHHRLHAEKWSLGDSTKPFEVIFVDRATAEMEDPSAGLDAYIVESFGETGIQATIYPDRRGPGYGMKRFRDHPACDFNRIRDEADVIFVHNSGFVAKTTATSPERLRTLLRLAAQRD